MYTIHCTMVIHLHAKQSMTRSRDKKAEAWTQSHVINPMNLTLRSMSYQDHECTWHILSWCANVKANRSYRLDMKTWQKPINLTLRSKVNIELGTWMYVSHLLMVIDPRTKYGKPMSNQKIVMGRTQKNFKNPIDFTLRSKFKVVSGSWMYATHRLMVIHPCAKYGIPKSNQKKVMGRTQKHVKNPINLTLRSKFKVVSDHESTQHIVSWWYTHVPNIVSQCKPKTLWAGHESAQIDWQSDSYKSPELSSRVVY